MKEITLTNELKNILMSSEQRKLRYSGDLNWLNTWENLWKSDRIRVGVIGVTSSGKSTLINALLGDELLSVAVRPSSSQLVSCSYSDERSATVYFLDGKKKILENSDQLKKSIIEYSDESYNSKNEKNVAQLELSTPYFDLGEDVLLVDSPGLDASGYESHEKLTLETLLPTVDVVIFVTTVKSEIDSKMKMTLDTIAKYNCPVMIVQNMLDAVRASIDGRKSAAEVARERMNRVQLAVDQSKIQNKNNVRISQISAINAMEYRCKKEHSDEDERNFVSSGYNSFISGVKDLIDSQRPEIERQRVNTVLEHIDELIRQENKRTENVNMSAIADNSLEKISDEITKALDTTHSEIQSVIDELKKIYDIYFSSKKLTNKGTFSKLNLKSPSFFSDKSIDEEDINEIKSAVKLFESSIITSVSSFAGTLTKIIRKLNLPSRDLWSYNGLPRMPEAEVKTKIVKKSRTVKKKGIHSVIRFFTFGLYKGEETENYTETIIDDKATSESLKRYINRLIIEYEKTLDAWQKNANSSVISINQEINLRIAAIKEKEKQIIDANEWKKTRKELEMCISAYEEMRKNATYHNDVSVQNQSIQDITQIVKVRANIIQLYNVAEHYLSEIQKSTFKIAIQKTKRQGMPSLILSNSADNLSDFLYRFHGISETDFKKETVYRIFDNITAVCSPTDEQLKQLTENSGGINIFLLINGMQFHTESETSLRNKIKDYLSDNDALFFIIEDFEMLANGNAVTESLRAVRLEQKKYKGILMINHNNPVYNMAVIQAQISDGKIKEETMFYNSLTAKFPSLIDEVSKKIINSILRS